MSFRYIDHLITPENLKQFLELADLAAGASKDVNNVFDLSDKLHPSRPMQLCIQAIQSNPASAEFLKERYIGPPYDLEAMLKMPKDSLGWTYAKVLSTLGYDPQFYRTPDHFENDAEYISFRVYKTHDLHHILTGFSLDNMGELGVISVTSGQTRYPAFIFIALMSLLISFFNSEQLYSKDLEKTEKARTLGYAFKLINQGIDMGQAAKPLFPIKLEEYLEHPLDEVRQELNIHPVTEGIYSWYSNPELQAALT
jgi:ubiquinone biosynthesis protein Coq4